MSVADEVDFGEEEAEMSGLGTDVLALACIAGGAAVSGMATMVWLDEGPERAEPARCVVEATAAAAPTMIVTAGGERARTVAVSWSDQRIGDAEACGQVERIERVRMETLAREMIRARAEVERARADVARASAEAERARAGFDRMRRDVERARVEAERRRR